MSVIVDKEKCIGCGLCASVCSEVFELGDDGIAKVKDANGDKKYSDKVKEATDSCPVQAIVVK